MTGAVPPQPAVCPYRGLAVFDEADAPFFFGREADTQHLLEQLRTQRFLAVIGPSGSGKSSFVRAGVLAQLRQGALPGSDGWTYLVFKPGARPLDDTGGGPGTAMKHQDNIDSLRNSLAASERELYLQTRLLLQAQPAEARVCLIIDSSLRKWNLHLSVQDQAYSLSTTRPSAHQFIDALRYAATVAGSQSVILLTMRADFLTRAAEYKPLAELLSAHQFLIGPMDRDDLRRACEEPAHRVGLTLEDGLTEAILDDVGREPGLLPLMQDVLLQLWEQRRMDQVMTLQGYRGLGSVRGALAKKADTLLTTMSPQQQTIVRRVFLRLTQPGEGTEDTRRRATMAALQTTAEETDVVADVVKILADARLLVTSEDQQVDVAHEALIRGWPRLRGWIEEDRSALRTHRRLTEAAEEWQRLQRDPGVLFRGALLTVAQEWRETHEADLNLLERDFLDASVALRNQEEAEARQQQRREQEQLRALAEAQAQRAQEQASAAEVLPKTGRLVALCGACSGGSRAFCLASMATRGARNGTSKHNSGQELLGKRGQCTSGGRYAACSAFLCPSGALMSDPSEVKNAIFAVHYYLKPFFLGFQMTHGAAVNGMVFSKDERLILSWGGWHGAAVAGQRWRRHRRDEARAGYRGRDLQSGWEPCAQLGWDGTVRLWQASNGAAIAVMKHEGVVGV